MKKIVLVTLLLIMELEAEFSVGDVLKDMEAASDAMNKAAKDRVTDMKEKETKVREGFLFNSKKVALVIGNSDYTQGFLSNPTKDADLIAQNLKDVGFRVMLEKNIKTAYEMEEVINKFARTLNKNDIAVVYYAGHGVQCKGKNYLIPTKANVARGTQLKSKAVDLDFLIGGVSEIKLAIVMLDACRNNTYPSCGRTRSRGLVQPKIENDGGMIISFATASNEIALDGNGNHSPYALALSKFMKKSMPIETYFRRVGGEVYGSSSQRPMLKNSFYGRFSFGDM